MGMFMGMVREVINSWRCCGVHFLVCFYGKPLTWGVLARFGVRVGLGQVKGPLGWVWLAKQTLYVPWVVAGWFGWLCLRGIMMALREVLQEGVCCKIS